MTTPMTDLPCVKLLPPILAFALSTILVLLVGPFAAAAYVFTVAPAWVGVAATLGAVAFAGVSGYVMSRSVHWAELDGDVIRERRLLTRKVIEHRVGDVVDARPIHTDFLGPARNAVLDFLLDTSNRGYQLFFRDGSRLALIRVDMSGIDRFLGAVAERLKEAGSSPRSGE